MKLRLLECNIRCLACRYELRLRDAVVQRVDRVRDVEIPRCHGSCPFPEIVGRERDCADCIGYEVVGGFLLCSDCGERYAIDHGIPRFYRPGVGAATRATASTASSYGYLWDLDEPPPSHFGKMERALSLSRPSGLILDAGCGAGTDLARLGGEKGVEIVGVELSDGGCRASFEQSLALPTAHVIQADLRHLPFDDDSFDLVYSYGVLHHLPAPQDGVRELVRVLKPTARVAAYLYEDFSDRTLAWRWLLAVVNQLRRVTLRLSHPLLYRLCQMASPLTYALFTIPFRMLRSVPGLSPVASRLPYRHATGPFSLAGDLYDRFSAPIEWRYSEIEARGLFQDAGLRDVVTAKDRGWMVAGAKAAPACRGPVGASS